MLSLAAVALVLGCVLAGGAYAVARVDTLDYRRTVVVVAVLLAAGGLTAQAMPTSVAPTPDASPTAESAAVAERTAVDGDAVSDRRSTDAATPDDATAPTNATVVGVSAPDRLTYRTESGARRTVRLAGVDAPSVDGADPAAFDGVVIGDRGRRCLADHGQQALVSARTDLLGERVTVQSVGTTAGTTAAVVALDGRSINRRLVERGRARATDGRYDAAERTARSAHRGLWSCSVVEADRPLRESNAPAVYIAAVHPNPPGDDRAALTDEYVVVGNDGDRTVDLSGWYLVVGDGEHYFFFEDYHLRPGEELVVHVGSGRDTDGHVYWGAGRALLDDDHETVTLVDGDTDRTIRLSY